MLSTLIWLPIIGAALIGFWPGTINHVRAHFLAWAVSGITFICLIVIICLFNFQNAGFQFQENFIWLDYLGLNYQIGVDGLSLPLVGLNILLLWTAIQISDGQEERPRLFYALILVLSGAVTGSFLAKNLLLFFLFYELELIPLYLLIIIWGGEKRGYAATKFLIYQALSGIVVLVGFLGWGWFTGSSSFSYEACATQVLPLGMQILLLSVIILGFGIKMPLVPFHTWLPDAYAEAPTPVSILLGGIVSKLGSYGLIRFGLELFPNAWAIVAPWLSILAVMTALYGGLVAIAQTDMKKMIAYSSIFHLSFVLLASAAATRLALLGAVCQMVAHSLILALLFLLVGIIEKKTGSRDLNVVKGLLNPKRGLPVTGGLIILAAMAMAGIPGMVGFVGEFLSFQGSFSSFPIPTLVCLASTTLTSVYFVILINRVFFGVLEPKFTYLPKVALSERLPAIILAILIVMLGVHPNWIVNYSQPTTNAIAATMPIVLPIKK